MIGPFELLALMSAVGAGEVTFTEQEADRLALVTVTVFVPDVE